MKWNRIAAVLVLLLPQASAAATRNWLTNQATGPNQVLFTLELTCPNTGFVCDLIDGYAEQDVSFLTGAGSLDLDDVADTFQFDADSMQDVGSGLQPAYVTTAGTDLQYPNIPFAGVPEITDVMVFALTNPLIAATGLDLQVPGDYPFSQSLDYSGTALVIGDLEFILGPNIVVPPASMDVAGTLRVLGDVDSNGSIDFELRDVTGTFTLQNVTTIGGELVTVDVTGDLTLNLSSEFAPPVPALERGAVAILVAALLATALVASSARRRFAR